MPQTGESQNKSAFLAGIVAVQVSSPLAGVRRTKSNCINNKSIGKATLFQSRFLYTTFLKN
ncbi:LPXTG cell wall anchor domain-containing protein [Lactobacillus delbrueckii subsp. bulgaricus]